MDAKPWSRPLGDSQQESETACMIPLGHSETHRQTDDGRVARRTESAVDAGHVGRYGKASGQMTGGDKQTTQECRWEGLAGRVGPMVPWSDSSPLPSDPQRLERKGRVDDVHG